MVGFGSNNLKMGGAGECHGQRSSLNIHLPPPPWTASARTNRQIHNVTSPSRSDLVFFSP